MVATLWFWLRKYYYSLNLCRFTSLKNLYEPKNFKFFHFFIAQFNFWHYLCTAFFGRGCRKGAKTLL